MKYKNGKDILPATLLEQLQNYVQGELVYIPRQESQRAGWGALNGTRLMIRMRNIEICRFYEDGTTISELMERYHLSEDSIRKVLNSRAVLLERVGELINES
jgi:Mor family transcriptional regulator